MKLVLNIIFCSLIFFACANDVKQIKENIAVSSNEIAGDESIDSGDQITDDVILAESQEVGMSNLLNKAPEQTRDNTDEQNVNDVPKTAPTIAQQQEAARKIQNELANRSPMPIEESVQEGAIFQKVVSTPRKKEEPKPSKASAKKKIAPKKTTKKQTYPAIEFEEMQIVFDTITEGDIFDHKFVFTNTGNAPLEIKSAKATCGCTQPSYPFIPIEPNEQGHISVRYNSVGKDGHQKPEVSVITNINSKEIILVMEGFVVQKEEIEGGK